MPTEYKKIKVSPTAPSPIGYIVPMDYLEADAWLRIFCSQIEAASNYRDTTPGAIAHRTDRAMEEFRSRFIE